MRRVLFAFFCIGTTLYGSAIVINNTQSLPNTDVVDWSQFLPDQVNLGNVFNAGSTYNNSVWGQLSNSNGSAQILIAGQNFTPKGGIQAHDALLSTDGNSTPGGTLTLSFTPQYGGGAYIVGDGGGQFTARIQAFAGFNNVLDTTVASDAAGDPIFLGVEDSVSEITKIVYSLVANSGGNVGDFAIDKFFVADTYQGPVNLPPASPAPASGVPEPNFTILSGVALLFFGWRALKLAACN